MPPLDPNIALQTRAPKMQSPLRMLGDVARLREEQDVAERRRQVLEQQQRDMDDDDEVESTLQRLGNPDHAIKELYNNGRPRAASKLAAQLYTQRDLEGKATKQKLDNAFEGLKFGTQALQGVTDLNSFGMAYDVVESTLGKEYASKLGTSRTDYNPDRVKTAIAWGKTAEQKLNEQKAGWEHMFKVYETVGKAVRDTVLNQKDLLEIQKNQVMAAASFLGNADSQEELNQLSEQAARSGVPIEVIAKFGSRWHPKFKENARRIGMTPKDYADVENQGVLRNQGQQNINLRGAELGERKASRLAGDSGGSGESGRGRSLTVNRQSEVAERRSKAYAEVEKEIRDTYSADKSGVINIPAAAQARINQRKLQIEDNYRTEMGMPPLLETERALASDPSRAAELKKVRTTYRNLTGTETPIEKISALKDKIRAEANPQKKAALALELRALLGR